MRDIIVNVTDVAGVLDPAGVARLDAVTARWRPAPFFVVLLGSGNAPRLVSALLPELGQHAEEAATIQGRSGLVTIISEEQLAIGPNPTGIGGAVVIDGLSCEWADPSSSVRAAALAMQLTGTIVMCVTDGQKHEALRMLGAAATLALAVRPHPADGKMPKLPCHLVWLDASLVIASNVGSPTGLADAGEINPDCGGGGGGFLTEMEATHDGPSCIAGAAELNRCRATLQEAFVSISQEAVSYADICFSRDRVRRVANRALSKARSAPLQSTVCSSLLALVDERIHFIEQSNMHSVPRDGPPGPASFVLSGWAASVARQVVEQDMSRWYAARSVERVELQGNDIEAKLSGVLHTVRSITELFDVSPEEQASIIAAARTVVDALRKDRDRRAAARQVAQDREVVSRATRHRGGHVSGSAILPVLRIELPPADEVPRCFAWIEPLLSPQYRFWITWTGQATVGVMALFFIITVALVLRS